VWFCIDTHMLVVTFLFQLDTSPTYVAGPFCTCVRPRHTMLVPLHFPLCSGSLQVANTLPAADLSAYVLLLLLLLLQVVSQCLPVWVNAPVRVTTCTVR